MYDIYVLCKFWQGRVVIERDPLWEENPGHVVGFAKDPVTSEVLVRVEFANGDRYNVRPDELDAL
jgi:hypothetical protein